MDCSYCGGTATQVDHIISQAEWRTAVQLGIADCYDITSADDPSNLTPACGPCNLSKGALDLDDWLAVIILGSPTATARVAVQHSRVARALIERRCAPWFAERADGVVLRLASVIAWWAVQP